MAQRLMASLSEDYDLEQERDRWVQSLNDTLRAKATDSEGPHGVTPAEPVGPTVDLMAALQEIHRRFESRTRRARRTCAAGPEDREGLEGTGQTNAAAGVVS
jgi:hypothetical protein